MWRARGRAGFSLIEIALALGVIAFALVAIVGLMSVSMKTGRGATEDTLLSSMTGQVMSGLRSQHFVDASHPAGTQGVLPDTAAVSSSAAITATILPTMYFDNSGALLSSSSGAPAASGALYQCVATIQPDAATMGPPSANGVQAINLVRVSLTFGWPPTANPPNERIVNSSIARY
ncbi:MAG TPA: hypothetical protein VHY22_04945 [Chthoniobacteraceae bacterium]|jgi:uncharacterized protein (TIGR02598 family)|nr:hypothetical protein [Chthoniobacteraceae bacterium]